MSFTGKAALVAGAGGGMGLAIANDLIAEGVNLALLDIKLAPDNIRPGPGRACYRQGDASDEPTVVAAVAETLKAFGRLDYLVNSIGVLWFGRDASLVEMDMAVWDRVLAINLKSFALTARHAIPEMRRAGGGAMVHFSSVQALRGDTKAQDAYGASKGAIRSLSKSLGVEHQADGDGGHVLRQVLACQCKLLRRTLLAPPKTKPTPACSCFRTRRRTSPGRN